MEQHTSFERIREAISAGKTTCADLVEHYLENIDKTKDLNAYLEVYADEARETAKQVDKKIVAGTAGKLAGMVVSLKDVLCHKDHGLQGASKILDGFESQFTGTAVQRLIDEDAVIIGRVNCDEFAMGSGNENSAFGPTRNPIDPERVPGGSSGASAAAVKADTCLVSIGSDTGGSVRQPAAFCDVVGLKPTYSRISRYGLTAYASSFDTVGVLANSVEDASIVLEVMAGQDDYDSTVSRKPVPEYSKLLGFDKKVKVAYMKETLESEGLSDEIKEKTLAKIEALRKAGHTVEEVSFPWLDYLLPTYYILTMAEASSNLSRFDGVRYGYRSPNTTDLESMYKKSRSEGFGEEVKRRIMLGTFVLSASYYDAYYTKAQKVRRLIKDYTEKLLGEYDFVVLPTTPTTAFKIGSHAKSDPVTTFLEDLYTVQASVSGLPAISVPNGHDQNGLPVGIQVMAGAFKEADMLAFAKYLSTL
ncbi:Asp-tRNA(Asn)/Glu-tRNA(Gln) amidotransferase subunit GatA [Fulvitalea axinellae]|uniref:Asp-tRNA(Asn)/Glu-tRNA(Gln) amidotransferase subunit GatA n=1 Tax=Fulvitalea axinellae TaxID=1182444 RepID=UPI0030CA2CE5